MRVAVYHVVETGFIVELLVFTEAAITVYMHNLSVTKFTQDS